MFIFLIRRKATGCIHTTMVKVVKHKKGKIFVPSIRKRVLCLCRCLITENGPIPKIYFLFINNMDN
jgi:CDGSH-type Zn-finger protein